jgi:hypothetical protein
MMKEQLSTFRSQLEDFARKHKVLLLISIPSLYFLIDWFLLVFVVGC